MRTDVTSQPVEVKSKVYYDDAILLDPLRAWTWVQVPEVPYALRSQDERRDLGWAATMSLARIGTGQVHIKKRPAAHDEKALAGWIDTRRAHVARYGEPSATHDQHLIAEQTRMLEVQPYGHQTFLGVELGRRSVLAQARDLLPMDDEPASPREVTRWTAAAAAQREALRRGALNAKPINGTWLRQLRQHTAFRGLDVPPASTSGRRWFGHAQTIDEFQGVEWRPVTFATRKGLRTCLQVTSPNSTKETYSASWVVAVMPQRMSFPNTPPWLAHADGLGFPIEVDAYLELVNPRTALRRIKGRLALAHDQERDSRFADVDLPIETHEVIALAREWEYKIPTRRMPMVWGHVVLRAEATSPETLATMYEHAQDRYGQLHIDLDWPGGMSQVDLAMQSIPGGPRKFASFRQVWPVETIGCGLMHAGSGLNHPTGMHVGWTTGRVRQQVSWDMHWSIRRDVEHGDDHIEGSGGTVLLGAPRSGKSNALVSIAYEHADAGLRGVLIDLGGETAKVQTLAPDRIDVVDVLQAGGGAIDPMSPLVIPGDPTDPRVRSSRERLTYSTFRLLGQIGVGTDADTALIQAIRKVAASQQPSSAAVLDVLRRSTTKAAKNLGESLSFQLSLDAAGAALVGEGGHDVGLLDKYLTVMTGRGIVMADPHKPVERWTADELLGGAVFGIVGHRVRDLLWNRDRGSLGYVAIDEAHVPLATPAGLQVISDLFRHGPKYGVATILATHNASAVGQDFIRNGTSTYMLFRATDPTEVSAGLRQAGFEDTREHRERRRTMRNGECMVVYPNDVRDVVQWDRWHEGVKAAANTTAGRRLAVA